MIILLFITGVQAPSDFFISYFGGGGRGGGGARVGDHFAPPPPKKKKKLCNAQMWECSNRDSNTLKLHEKQKYSQFPHLMNWYNSETSYIQKLHDQSIILYQQFQSD